MQLLDFLQKTQKSARRIYANGQNKNELIDRYNGLYQEQYFCELLSLERKRSERSRKPFLLMIGDLSGFADRFEKHVVAKKLGQIFFSLTRETDIKGWYRYDSLIGVIFTEFADNEKNLKSAQKLIVEKCINVLEDNLERTEFEKILLTWHIFPGRFDKVFGEDSTDTKVYPDVLAKMKRKRSGLFVKRMIDIIGSILALTFFSPLYVVVALFIKFTSDGPVHFKQERVGLFGKKFVFLKFRSMYTGNDPSLHKEYVRCLIQGKGHSNVHSCIGNNASVYKMEHDPRVTKVGKLLRKTSLDELPQFINVLRGDMSLVGPRPPIPYECEEYDVWHRKRLLEMKPGITGLWQVKGRSTTTFNEMVRMDIQYIQEWSLWLDVKILLQTPFVVISGKGAY